MTVKWGKEQFPDIEVNTDEDPMLFKAQLFALTGVRPDRQKVMCKGVALKDTDWGKMPIKNVSTVIRIIPYCSLRVQHLLLLLLPFFIICCYLFINYCGILVLPIFFPKNKHILV